MLKESLGRFTPPVYGKTRRTAETYQTVARRCLTKISELVNEYHGVRNNQQLLREIRNDIDYYLRRYHEYCIKQRDGMAAHYHEIGADADTDFEHLIPAARIRDLLLSGVLSTEQALNAPTVRLSRNKHKQLGEAGWSSSTPDMWRPFRRYTQVFDAEFQTFDGQSIDLETWTLEDHYRRFDYLKIAV
jgi:exopolyphosphatase/pppGpp-phosphohydrolase